MCSSNSLRKHIRKLDSSQLPPITGCYLRKPRVVTPGRASTAISYPAFHPFSSPFRFHSIPLPPSPTSMHTSLLPLSPANSAAVEAVRIRKHHSTLLERFHSTYRSNGISDIKSDLKYWNQQFHLTLRAVQIGSKRVQSLPWFSKGRESRALPENVQIFLRFQLKY